MLDIWYALCYIDSRGTDSRKKSIRIILFRKENVRLRRSLYIRILNMDEPIIRLRPHHALCIRHFAGHGYSPEFTENMTRLIARLNSGDHVMVQIIMHRDSLCAACPHDHDHLCATEEKVHAFDLAVASACGLRSGQWLSWQELCALTDEHIFRPGLFESICATCEWFSLCRKQRQSRQ